MSPSDERRHSERIPINEEFSAEGSTWVSDLSIGGVFVHTEERVPIGIVVALRFSVLLEDPIVIEATGKVVRHSRHPPGIGVQFDALSKEMRDRIEQVLARQRPVDSGAPVRLPDPGRASEESPISWARPAPVGGLRLTAADSDASIPIFRPPPLPGKPKASDGR